MLTNKGMELAILSFIRWNSFFVLSSYALSVATGHKYFSSMNAGKKNSTPECEGRDCFYKCQGINTTPSGQKDLLLRSRAAKSDPLHGRVKANSIAVLIVRSSRERLLDGPFRLNILRTKSTSQTEWYFGLGGLSLTAPFRSLDIKGCCPTDSPSTFS